MKVPPREVWGPQLWGALFAIAAGLGNAPDDELQETTSVFIYALEKLLPCEECREHYAQFIRENPVEPFVISDRKLARWIQKLKNSITSSITSLRKRAPEPLILTQDKSLAKKKEVYKKHKVPGIPNPDKPMSSRQARALKRLAQSAKNYKRPCSC